MDELTELRERMRTQRPVEWDQLPDFPLYMDQVLSYMDRQILHFEENDALTAAMVNNYTKSGLVPRAEGKKYNREHLAYLTAICVLKRVLSAKDMSLVLDEELHSRPDIGESYETFRESLGKTLNLVTDIMEAYDEDDAADGAVHIALLSYAAGLASSRYVKLLREKQEPGEQPPARRGKEKHLKVKKETADA